MNEPALLPKDRLIKTGEIDRADWNFQGILGRISRTRFKMLVKMLRRQKPKRILEIGYGSGIFMPELARHCQELFGLDIHDQNLEVARVLAELGVTARLTTGTAERLEFPDAFFDCVVAVSALEFVPDISSAAKEINRVLTPEGHLILVTPGHSPIVDFGLKILTGESAREGFGNRRESLLPALSRFFRENLRQTFPPFVGQHCLYKAVDFTRK